MRFHYTKKGTVHPRATESTANVAQYYGRFMTRIGYNLLLGHNQHFGYYDAQHITEKQAQINLHKKLANLLELKPGMRVLDAGCGQGTVATYLASTENVHVTGITIVPHEIEAAEKRAKKMNVSALTEFLIQDYSDLSRFDEGSFDRIYTVETLSHAVDAKQVLEQFVRVLKPGGRAVFIEYDCDTVAVEKEEPGVGEYLKAKAGIYAFGQYQPGMFIRTLKSVGFREIQEYDWTKAVLPSMRRLRRIASPAAGLVSLLHLENYAVNTVAAHMYADWVEKGHFKFKAYSAIK